MLHETTRPLSGTEQRLLRRRLTVSKTGSVFWMRDERRAALMTVSVCAGIVTVGMLAPYPVIGVMMAGVFALMRYGGYLERRRLQRHMLAYRQRLADELELGQAYTISCRPKRIFGREELDDEGAVWIFDNGDSRYLAICGQDYRESSRFPSSHFEVVMGARYRSVIAIRSHGPRFPSTIEVRGDGSTWSRLPEREITIFTAPPDADLPVLLRSLESSKASA